MLLLFAALECAPGAQMTACRVQGVPARCTVVSVREDRLKTNGRALGLKIVVVPALKSRKGAIFVLHGGPGGAATDLTAPISDALAAAREEHDLVFADQRGSGESNGLRCVALSGGALGPQLYPPDSVRACRKELEGRADLSCYNTENSVADLEAIRKELGYAKVSFFGLSYGTRLAQAYLRVYPQNVERAALIGVAPLHSSVFDGLSKSAQGALDRLFADCRNDDACNQAFPSLAAEYSQLVARVARNEEPLLDRRGLNLGTLFELYYPAKLRRLPLLLHQAHQGNPRPLAMELRSTRREVFTQLSPGLHFSIVCSEDFPFARPTGQRESAIGSQFIQEYGFCSEWPKANFPEILRRRQRTQTPALLIAGELDPVTPPALAQEVARDMPNARVIAVPGGGHMVADPAGCINLAVTSFFNAGTPDLAALRCIAGLRRPPFETQH
jgi:pimeloyl-ACP methyl ester carboxylesterase